MAVTLDPDVLHQYRRLSLYNSPYPAHDRGCAIDLYPPGGTTPSPVAGTVLDTRTVDAPPKPYAVDQDHLLLVETGDVVARILHVDPAVETGDHLNVGDSLGTPVRSGFFAPWVDNHIHLGFRPPDANHYRASGSLPVEIDIDLRPCSWDGHGTVVETGETSAVLDTPTHPAPGEYFVGVDGGDCVLDGGLPHYQGGGGLGGGGGGWAGGGSVSLAGQRVGTADGRTVTWDDVIVRANGTPITGLSLFCSRDPFGVKLVCPDHSQAVGEDVTVTIEPA